MAHETAEQVKQFLVLSQKNAAELRAICEGLNLDTTGDQSTLLDRVMALGNPQQNDIIQPQLIPLRTRDERGNVIQPAHQAIYHWRGQIYNAKNNYKEFKMLNSHGQLYGMKMRYILCPEKILKVVLDKKWYDPQYMGQNELIKQLSMNPDKFTVSIVQRNGANGNSYVMLHCEPKAA